MPRSPVNSNVRRLIKNMQLDDIHWHDSSILSVQINPEEDVIEMRLLYPEDWESDTYVERTVVFEDAYGYKEFQGPFKGSPTILSVEVVEKGDYWSQLRIETNAGYCEIYCVDAYFKSS